MLVKWTDKVQEPAGCDSSSTSGQQNEIASRAEEDSAIATVASTPS